MGCPILRLISGEGWDSTNLSIRGVTLSEPSGPRFARPTRPRVSSRAKRSSAEPRDLLLLLTVGSTTENGCPILRLLSGEGWDSTNPNQQALYQGMSSLMPQTSQEKSEASAPAFRAAWAPQALCKTLTHADANRAAFYCQPFRFTLPPQPPENTHQILLPKFADNFPLPAHTRSMSAHLYLHHQQLTIGGSSLSICRPLPMPEAGN